MNLTNILLTPAIAFVVYLALAAVLNRLGKSFAGNFPQSKLKSSVYSGGEASPTTSAVSGYRQFFVIALFFAVLHLGSLVLANSHFAVTAGLYLGGLLLALVALILG
jgi:NADH:ubiquinone oxidoreductase subunit 3 (subunit A)